MGCGSSTHEPRSPQAAQANGGRVAQSNARAPPPHSHAQHPQQPAAAAAANPAAPAAAAAAPPGGGGGSNGGASARGGKKDPSSGDKDRRGNGSSGKASTEDRYEIIKVLGEGASCKVVSARDKQTQVGNCDGGGGGGATDEALLRCKINT